MSPPMARTGSLLRAAALLSAAAIPVGGPTVRHVDAPLLRIACDELPLKVPNPVEAQDDERERPYFALIRTWTFPSLEPLDVPVERVELRGAASAARVGRGEYLFSNISVGYTSVTLLAERGEAASPTERALGKRSLATRNPLVLARNAITTCDLYVASEEQLGETTTMKGLVVDRATGAPLAGARVRCGEPIVEAGADGRFEFAAPVTWRALLSDTVVAANGFRPYQMSPTHLSAPWIERLRHDGEAIFTLVREPPAGSAKDVKGDRDPGLLPRLER